MGSLSLLQGNFPTQELNWGLLHCRQILYQQSCLGAPYRAWCIPSLRPLLGLGLSGVMPSKGRREFMRRCSDAHCGWVTVCFYFPIGQLSEWAWTTRPLKPPWPVFPMLHGLNGHWGVSSCTIIPGTTDCIFPFREGYVFLISRATQPSAKAILEFKTNAQVCLVKQVRERQICYDITCMWNPKKKYNKLVNITKRNRLADIENKLVVTRGEKGEGAM